MKSTESVKIVKITDKKITKMIEKLAAMIRLNNEKFDYIVGIERGGLHVSVPLAKMLDVSHKSIKISFYGEGSERAKDPTVDMHGLVIQKTDKVLFVDDLVDSGATLKYFKDNIQCKYKSASLFWNKDGKYGLEPDYYVDLKFMNTWLTFPWE